MADETLTMEVDSENEEERKPLVTWKNPPSLTDLKRDLEESKPSHLKQVQEIEIWLDNLNITGKAKIAPKPGRSSIQPKLIRKQAQ